MAPFSGREAVQLCILRNGLSLLLIENNRGNSDLLGRRVWRYGNGHFRIIVEAKRALSPEPNR
jgi:hypothetical protein